MTSKPSISRNARHGRARWTDDDISFLRCHGHMGAFYMAGDLGRTEAAVHAAASKHKIRLGGTLGRRSRLPPNTKGGTE